MINYLKSLPPPSQAQVYPFQRQEASPSLSLDQIDPSRPEVLYAVNVIRKVVTFLKSGLSVHNVTERDMDMRLFSDIFGILNHWVYRETLSRMSKARRKSLSGKSGYLCDYLRVVLFLYNLS